MPANPRQMALRTNKSKEELKLQANDERLKRIEKYKPPRKNTRMFTVMSDIVGVFTMGRERNPKLKAMAATDISWLYDKYSPPTVVKAKKLLGIKSKRVDGTWWWTAPRYTPDEAIDKEHARRFAERNEEEAKTSKLNRASVRTLVRIMEEANYYASSRDVVNSMAAYGEYSRGTTLHAKADLGIVTRIIMGRPYWVWGPKKVQDWLGRKLSRGPMNRKDIFARAEKERGWDHEVVTQAMFAMPWIKCSFLNDEAYFVDINHIDPEESETEPEVINPDEWADIPEE